MENRLFRSLFSLGGLSPYRIRDFAGCILRGAFR
jgi:hypothetical protein